MHNDKGDVTANTYAQRESVYSRIIVTIGHTSQAVAGEVWYETRLKTGMLNCRRLG
jgi:hypothetical protein